MTTWTKEQRLRHLLDFIADGDLPMPERFDPTDSRTYLSLLGKNGQALSDRTRVWDLDLWLDALGDHATLTAWVTTANVLHVQVVAFPDTDVRALQLGIAFTVHDVLPFARRRISSTEIRSMLGVPLRSPMPLPTTGGVVI